GNPAHRYAPARYAGSHHRQTRIRHNRGGAPIVAALFLDSSSLVKRYVRETGSAWVAGLTTPSAGNWLYLCRITGVEIVSAVTRKARAGGISSADARAALASSNVASPSNFLVIEVTPSLFSEAM